MDPVHDVAPDVLVEGGAAVIHASVLKLLVVVTSAPYAGGIIRRVAHEPYIVVGGGGAALAGRSHACQGSTGAGGVDGHARAGKFAVTLHGFGHGVRQKEGSGIL